MLATGCGSGSDSSLKSNAAGTVASPDQKEAYAEPLQYAAADDNNTGLITEKNESASAGSGSETESEEADDPEAYERENRTVFAMDTFMDITAFGSGRIKACDDAEEEIRRLDALLTSEGDESEIAMLNRNGRAELSGDTLYLMDRSLEFASLTGGVFDIAIYPMMELWGFTGDAPALPSEDEIRELLPICDPSFIRVDSNTGEASFTHDGVKADLGGIAKGYTSARIMEIFRQDGITSGMVNLGGNVQTLGTKPDGSCWRIAVRDPDGDGMLGVLELTDKAAITSGGYERYFEENGETWHHIIDPATGYPARSGLKSVTIVSDDGTLADALSTSLYIMGAEGAEAYWRRQGASFGMVLYTDNGDLLITEDLEPVFMSELRYSVLKK